MTIVDDLMETQEIRQGDLAVVFRTLAERKKEPVVYEGVRATARKRKHFSGVDVDDEMDADGDAEAPTAKKRRITDSPANIEKVMANAVEPNIGNIVNGGAEDNIVQLSLASLVDGEVEDNESVAVKSNLENVMDAHVEDNEMGLRQSQVNTENSATGSQ
jgi:hypothetical protein